MIYSISYTERVISSSFDGIEFQETKRSRFFHSETFGPGNYRGNPFTVGTSPKSHGEDWKYFSRKTEIFYMNNMDWSHESVPDYPFATDSE